MESLMRLCLRLDHSTPNGYCPLSLRGRRLGVRLVIAVVQQPASSRGRRSRGRNLFIVAIMRQSVTQGSSGCKVGFGRTVWTGHILEPVLKMGGAGDSLPTRSRDDRRPELPQDTLRKGVPIGANCRSGSVRRVAGPNRRVTERS